MSDLDPCRVVGYIRELDLGNPPPRLIELQFTNELADSKSATWKTVVLVDTADLGPSPRFRIRARVGRLGNAEDFARAWEQFRQAYEPIERVDTDPAKSIRIPRILRSGRGWLGRFG